MSDREIAESHWKYTEGIIKRSHLAYIPPNNYTKMKCKPLSTEQGYMATPQNAQGRRRKQNVSSRQEFQDELGYLLLSLPRCYSDDEREKHLRFIEWTLRRYIQLVERS